MDAERRTPRDDRRRALGQNFLVDPAVLRRALPRFDLEPDQLVVELGAGRGALTLPLARAGARIVAVERDPVWARRLTTRLRDAGLDRSVQVVTADLRRMRLPREPYRVIANIPFALTTTVLDLLLVDPEQGPWRVDLLVQWEVARKRAAQPPTTLRSAAWAPWWSFEVGDRVPRRAFRPVPRADGGWLTITRRPRPILPTWLAPGFQDALRDVWAPPARR